MTKIEGKLTSFQLLILFKKNFFSTPYFKDEELWPKGFYALPRSHSQSAAKAGLKLRSRDAPSHWSSWSWMLLGGLLGLPFRTEAWPPLREGNLLIGTSHVCPPSGNCGQVTRVSKDMSPIWKQPCPTTGPQCRGRGIKAHPPSEQQGNC